MGEGSRPPGWYQDPTGQSEGRYWNGTSWTQMSNRGGQTVNVPIDPELAEVPPVAGTQVMAPVPAVPASSSSRSSGGAMIAVVIGLLFALAVFVAIDGTGSTQTPGDGSSPTEDAPAEEAPAEEAPAEEAPAEE